jgi:hypothetical protein
MQPSAPATIARKRIAAGYSASEKAALFAGGARKFNRSG